MSRPVQWWQTRNPREQAMVAVMAVSVAVFIGWFVLYLPARGTRDDAVERREQAARSLAEIEAGVAILNAGRGAAGPTGDAFNTVLVSSARAAGIAIARQQPGADRGIELGTDAVNPVELFRWLDALHRRHGITPRQVRLFKADGRLRADLVFAPGPA